MLVVTARCTFNGTQPGGSKAAAVAAGRRWQRLGRLRRNRSQRNGLRPYRTGRRSKRETRAPLWPGSAHTFRKDVEAMAAELTD